MSRMIPTGSYAPMPAFRKTNGANFSRLPGGLPPVGYRNRNDWSGAYGKARSDGTSAGCRLECFHSTSEWDKTANKGKGRFVAS
jgi:hypothetical protein